MRFFFYFLPLLSFIIISCGPENQVKEAKVEKAEKKEEVSVKQNPVVISQKVKEFLGEEILTIITNPDKIESYQVQPKKNKTAGALVLHEYAIVKKGPDLSDEQKKAFIALLSDEKTYVFDFAKKGFLFPEYGMLFIKGAEQVILLVDKNRKELMFVYKGQEKKEDFDPVFDKVMALIDSLFQNTSGAGK